MDCGFGGVTTTTTNTGSHSFSNIEPPLSADAVSEVQREKQPIEEKDDSLRNKNILESHPPEQLTKRMRLEVEPLDRLKKMKSRPTHIDWTDELHDLFLEAIEKNGWNVGAKTIQKHMNIPDMTATQIDSRLLSYQAQIHRFVKSRDPSDISMRIVRGIENEELVILGEDAGCESDEQWHQFLTTLVESGGNLPRRPKAIEKATNTSQDQISLPSNSNTKSARRKRLLLKLKESTAQIEAQMQLLNQALEHIKSTVSTFLEEQAVADPRDEFFDAETSESGSDVESTSVDGEFSLIPARLV
eukprot:c5485_g1_i1.p1 GENE.c5485_g1_i1~~c5485_g1_i1.p1  ORF type:complete len:301 (+),score=67.14 c5485_g1_i1:28-930(+)